MEPSVVFHIKWIYRKPLNTRVQGVARREWWFYFQGLQHRNRVFNSFPKGETREAIRCVAPDPSRFVYMSI